MAREPKTYHSIAGSSRVVSKSGVIGINGPPYNTNNPYSYVRCLRTRADPYVTHGFAASDYPGHFDKLYRETETVRRRLYGKLVNEIASKGELLTAGVEWRKSLEMIVKRTNQLRSAVYHLRRFDIASFCDTLAIAPESRRVPKDIKRYAAKRGQPAHLYWKIPGRRNPKKVSPKEFELLPRASKTHLVSNAWLEYWLGWAPSIGDIKNAIETMSREFPAEKFRVSSSSKISRTYEAEHPAFTSRAHGFSNAWVEGKVSGGLYGKVKVSNYNLYLAGQLGLLNPVLTAFQVIPLSFIINWFVNIEQWLGTISDFAGLTFSEVGYGYRVKGNAERREWRVENPAYNVFNRTLLYTTLELNHLIRTPSQIEKPPLVVRFDGLSKERAFTACALLNELFIKPF